MSYQVLARKWRPRIFSEMVGQEHVLRALINALDSERLHHAFLFTGTRGVGKTTIARILAKSLNCEQGVSSQPCGQCAACTEIDEGRFVDLIEVDAASRTKVEDTRDLLDNVQYAPTRGRYKVYLIDEVHMLSNHSFNALLKTLEEPPPHVKFLLATTDPQKLPVTILSRCLQFNLRRLPLEQIQAHLSQLLHSEAIEYEEAALHQLARVADGSMRDGLSLLDQAIAFGAGAVREADVRAMLGSIEQNHIYKLLEALASSEGSAVIQCVHGLAEQAPAYADVLAELITMLHHLALLQQVPDAYDETMGDKASLMQLAQTLSAEDIQLYYQIGLNGRRDLPLAPDPRTGLEMVLLRMLAFRPAALSDEHKPQQEKLVEKKSEPQTNAAQTGAEPLDISATPSTPTGQSDDWHRIAAALPLIGALQQLAAHCVIVEQDKDNIHLALDMVSAPLLTKEREARMQQALSDYYGRQIKLKIALEEVEDETPAQREKRIEKEKQTAAESAIDNDTNVKSLIEVFDGQVRPNSVQPVD